ncbi:MAG: hypothetical protein COT15_05030 [Candidatus Diapherotrites archaeon CG08_land_8_20_14_0_20_34_12]|nr:MAG: hypothetical protein COT15_05030 [Candidatus Diapherotrites archaeon CG08_land_8_20_14_0_20_34_12]
MKRPRININLLPNKGRDRFRGLRRVGSVFSWPVRKPFQLARQTFSAKVRLAKARADFDSVHRERKELEEFIQAAESPDRQRQLKKVMSKAARARDKKVIRAISSARKELGKSGKDRNLIFRKLEPRSQRLRQRQNAIHSRYDRAMDRVESADNLWLLRDFRKNWRARKAARLVDKHYDYEARVKAADAAIENARARIKARKGYAKQVGEFVSARIIQRMAAREQTLDQDRARLDQLREKERVLSERVSSLEDRVDAVQGRRRKSAEASAKKQKGRMPISVDEAFGQKEESD